MELFSNPEKSMSVSILYRYTLTFKSLGNLLQKDLDEFVTQWNEHTIWKNCQTLSPHGCPINIVYSKDWLHCMSDVHKGAQDHLQHFDSDMWAHCMLYESKPPPRFFPTDYKNNISIIFNHTFGIMVDNISHVNCCGIYLRVGYSIGAARHTSVLYVPVKQYQWLWDNWYWYQRKIVISNGWYVRYCHKYL